MCNFNKFNDYRLIRGGRSGGDMVETWKFIVLMCLKTRGLSKKAHISPLVENFEDGCQRPKKSKKAHIINLISRQKWVRIITLGVRLAQS